MTVIKVEKLGKKYILTHQRKEPYIALRDVITEKAKTAVRKLSRPLLPKTPNSTTDTAHEEFWALKDVSFEVKQGDRVGIIGRNGAGKSTLLKILSRITEPTTGRIGINGRVASLLEVGTGFHPELTGRENIFLNGAVLGMTKAEIKKKFDEIVDFAEIEKFLDTPVKRYSSGMYVRLAFAVAAHLEPEILVVDEVLAVGDAQFQKKCLGKMGEVGKDGRTVLFVSHQMPAVEVLCTGAILLEQGLIVAAGEVHSIVETYMSRMIKTSQTLLASGGTHNIRSVKISNAHGLETDHFSVGDDLVFDIELFHSTFVEKPRLSIGIHTPNGERLATIHTDIQQNKDWAFQGTKRLRAVWRKNRLVPARYRVDIAFWGYSGEIETLHGAKHFEILARDIYDTGLLPDPSFQGHMLPDALWDMEPVSE
jgi:lipopolysaccharide transport system ATP-binding protein